MSGRDFGTSTVGTRRGVLRRVYGPHVQGVATNQGSTLYPTPDTRVGREGGRYGVGSGTTRDGQVPRCDRSGKVSLRFQTLEVHERNKRGHNS